MSIRASASFTGKRWREKRSLMSWGFAFLAALVLTMVPLVGHAIPVESVPNPQATARGWITDMANVLSSSTKTSLNQRLSQLESENGVEFAIVTVPDTQPYATPKEFTTTLFNHWGIGKLGQDNGLLMMVSMGDRRVEIETGYGVEGILPDARVGTIIERQILPRFRSGNPEAGIVAGVDALLPILQGQAFESNYARISSFFPSSVIWFSLGLLVIGSGVATFCFWKSRQIALTPLPIPTRGVFRLGHVDPNNAKVSGWVWIGTASVAFSFFFFVVAATNMAGSLFISVVYAGVASIICSLSLVGIISETWFNPNKASRSHRLFHCQVCDTPMVGVDEQQVTSQLNQPQKVAMHLGSMAYEGWRCPSCSPQIQDGLHIRAYELGKRFNACPHCHERTMTSLSEVLVPPTYSAPGLRVTTYTCHCCTHQSQKEYVIPKLQRASSSSSSSNGGSFSGGSSGGGGSFGGGSSGGGGSFGGGSSGGGGAGGSW
uniref:TPM domain-containing protein n=1 Tax=Petrachloros mirabilis TaxID=2918835 RepID=UPI001EE8914C|nr:TPM domain-containing protein [Petrachloros mirabilis]